VICPPCREAGHLNADANRVYDEESAAYLRIRATEKHGECRDPKTCPCRHTLGDFTNRRTDG
jgi:hypothetical protein